jgi:hypothetical protein
VLHYVKRRSDRGLPIIGALDARRGPLILVGKLPGRGSTVRKPFGWQPLAAAEFLRLFGVFNRRRQFRDLARSLRAPKNRADLSHGGPDLPAFPARDRHIRCCERPCSEGAPSVRGTPACEPDPSSILVPPTRFPSPSARRTARLASLDSSSDPSPRASSPPHLQPAFKSEPAGLSPRAARSPMTKVTGRAPERKIRQIFVEIGLPCAPVQHL